jgi:hypothetical protein
LACAEGKSTEPLSVESPPPRPGTSTGSLGKLIIEKESSPITVSIIVFVVNVFILPPNIN